METTKERIKKSIDKCLKRLSELEGKNLSEHGHWDKGYWTGRKGVLEDWYAELNENLNKKGNKILQNEPQKENAKAVILKTDEGVRLMGSIQCSDGAWFDAEGCYQYCNCEKTNAGTMNQVHKLIYGATLIGHNPKAEKDWYRNRENFIDVEISFSDVDQTFPKAFEL